MRKINLLLTIVFTLITVFSFGQEHETFVTPQPADTTAHTECHSKPGSEVSIHVTKTNLSRNNTIKDWALRFWGLHSFNKGIELEAHGGFNYENTLNINAGYNIFHKKGQRWLVPKGGLMIGTHWGLSVGFLNQFEYKRLYIFNTLEFGFNFIHPEDQIFNFLEIGYEAHKNVEIGFITENRYHFYRGTDHTEKTEDNFDIGPVLRTKFKKVYFELWYATAPLKLEVKEVFVHDAKLTLGFGWRF